MKAYGKALPCLLGVFLEGNKLASHEGLYTRRLFVGEEG